MQATQRTALVTGASRGIGRAIALGLARDGYSVVGSYSSEKARADELVREILALPGARERGQTAAVFPCDIAQPAQVAQLFDVARAELGHLDVVVANAGIELIDVPVTDYTEADYDRVFDVNTKGTFFTLQRAAEVVATGGRVVVVCSNTTSLALPGFAVYGASKLAPKYFVEVLAKELGSRGITVNSVSPGVTRAAGVFTATPTTTPTSSR